MNLFFSFSFIIVIALVDFICLSNQRWFLLGLVAVIALLFWATLYRELQLRKVLLLIGFLAMIAFSFWWAHAPQSNSVPSAQTTRYQVVHSMNNSMIVSNERREKIFINRHFLYSHRGATIPRVGDTFLASITIESRVNFQKSDFDRYLASQKTYWKGQVRSWIDSSYRPGLSLRNRVMNWFDQPQYKKIKNWILFLIFQESNSDFAPVKDRIYNLGIAHIFVISGFHLSLVGGFWFFLAKKCRQQWIKRLLMCSGLLFCAFLTYLTNWKISALKSLVFLFLNFLFFRHSFFRNRLTKTELISLLGLTFLVVNPFFFYRLEFQLSFLAGWCLYFANQYLRRGDRWWLRRALITNLFIWVSVFPIVINIAFRFYLFSPLLILFYGCWALVFYPLFFAGVWIPFFSAFLTTMLHSIEWSFRFFDQMFLYVPFGAMSEPLILLFYVILIGSVFVTRWIGTPMRNFVVTLPVLVLIFAGQWFGATFYHFSVIDVGHGLAMFLQSPDRKTNILFDAGSGRRAVNNTRKISNFLKKKHVKTIDAVFISHDNTDHFNNLAHLQANFTIDKVFTNRNAPKDYVINNIAIRNWAAFFADLMVSENNRSLILEFVVGQSRFLLMFDAEKEAEHQLMMTRQPIKVNFLQVGHHGSTTSSAKPFLQTTNPDHCLISNRRDVDESRFLPANCHVYQTSQLGSIDILLAPTPKITNHKPTSKN